MCPKPGPELGSPVFGFFASGTGSPVSGFPVFFTPLTTSNKSFNLLRLNHHFFFFFLILNLLHYYQAKNISNTKKFIISYPWLEIWMGMRVFEIKSKKVVKERKPKESLTKQFDLGSVMVIAISLESRLNFFLLTLILYFCIGFEDHVKNC
jgi:hypothetical protein